MRFPIDRAFAAVEAIALIVARVGPHVLTVSNYIHGKEVDDVHALVADIVDRSDQALSFAPCQEGSPDCQSLT